MTKPGMTETRTIPVCIWMMLSLGVATQTFAEAVPLGQLGCDAPQLEGLEWVKGDPVEMQTGSVYVIEFWATWCGPCVGNMPHLSNLQDTHGDEGVTVIGLSNEPLQTAVAFLVANDRDGVRQRDIIQYTLGTDPDNSTWDDYMTAYEAAIVHTSTQDAPWFVVPADRKWYRNLVVARIIIEALESMELAYPVTEHDLDGIIVD